MLHGMTDMHHISFAWEPPLQVAAHAYGANADAMALFLSSESRHYSGRYSYIAMQPQQEIKAAHFADLEAELTSNKPWYENAWFGYMGYGLKNDVETLPVSDGISPLYRQAKLPELWMVRYGVILRFDHDLRRVDGYFSDQAVHEQVYHHTGRGERELHSSMPKEPAVSVQALNSNMSKQSYLQKVEEIKAAIVEGTLYQANLTRKFYGSLEQQAGNKMDLFAALIAISPSPYTAFMRLGEAHVLSSSPEQFLQIDAEGAITTRPIKGTAARSEDAAEDDALRAQLQTSEKDRAENLMIVDLMRNDIARTSVAGSVKTPHLFEVMRHPTIHHMSSTVTGQKHANYGSIDTLRMAFPPGSMTGAPKIKAMELCSALEPERRGMYSGIIGWLGGDGSADTSVVIRTLLLHKNQFEFQVGGGIVHDSTPENEWRETLDKARAIMALLGIKRSEMEGV